MSQSQLSPDQANALWREAAELKRSDKRRNHKKAIQLALRLIEEGPNTPAALSMLKCFVADIYSQNLRDHDKAIEYYLQALDDDPNNSLAGSNLGFVYLKYKKDYRSAVQTFEQTLDRGVSEVFIRESTKDWLADAKQKLEG